MYMVVLNATRGGAVLETCSQTGAAGSCWQPFRAPAHAFTKVTQFR